jgi:hypothetical protein
MIEGYKMSYYENILIRSREDSMKVGAVVVSQTVRVAGVIAIETMPVLAPIKNFPVPCVEKKYMLSDALVDAAALIGCMAGSLVGAVAFTPFVFALNSLTQSRVKKQEVCLAIKKLDILEDLPKQQIDSVLTAITKDYESKRCYNASASSRVLFEKLIDSHCDQSDKLDFIKTYLKEEQNGVSKNNGKRLFSIICEKVSSDKYLVATPEKKQCGCSLFSFFGIDNMINLSKRPVLETFPNLNH